MGWLLLEKFIPFIPSYTKDCFQVKRKLEELGTLPPGTFITTMGDTTMYTNICTNHGLKVLEQIMKMLAHNLPEYFPLDLVMHAMTLIMRFNAFEAYDTFIAKPRAQQWIHQVLSHMISHAMASTKLPI